MVHQKVFHGLEGQHRNRSLFVNGKGKFFLLRVKRWHTLVQYVTYYLLSVRLHCSHDPTSLNQRKTITHSTLLLQDSPMKRYIDSSEQNCPKASYHQSRRLPSQ